MRDSVILLMGPTAAGKTALALDWAERIDGEIISVDSALVYRGMDIGTAKPTLEERSRVPHHLIDIREPEAAWSAADFVTHAQGLIADIRARGHTPLLVGGTMLYFRALLQGLDAMPAIDPEVRRALRARLPMDGAAALHRELQAIDPAAAKRIHPNDPQRILRALEVFHSTGATLSSFQTRASGASSPCGAGRVGPGGGGRSGIGSDGVESDRVGPIQTVPVSWRCVALWPEDRAGLRERIAQRFDAMLAAGFLDELRRLHARPGLTAEHPSQRAVGYRQGWQWLSGEIDTAGLRERAITATRQLAKRQLTWLRGLPDLEYRSVEGLRVQDLLQ